MLSVCIPIYNFDVRNLVHALDKQRRLLDVEVEIICIDDGSDNHFQQVNSEIKGVCNAYTVLASNIGRSAIRNKFLEFATHDYLLFLDCDGILTSDDFLSRYIEYAEQHKPDVVSGGREYGEKPSDVNKIFRWKYGTKKEAFSASSLAKESRKILLTNNFLIRKPVLERIRFDESLEGYGHEDTLFSYRLGRANIVIEYFENPVLDGDLESPDVFLAKTKEGINNLYEIYLQLNQSQDFSNMVPLLKTYKNLRGFRGIYSFIYGIFSGMIKKNLHSENPSLFAFNLYKLNELISYSKESK